MAFWPIKVTCLRCDCPSMTMLAPPARTGRCDQLAAVWQCEDCHSEFVVNIDMSCSTQRNANQGPPKCGTERGYQRHQYLGTDSCKRCSEAHARHNNGPKVRAS